MKHSFWLTLIVTGAPLIVYPFILLANVMSLAGSPSSSPVSPALRLASQAFLWSATLYPIAYVYSLQKCIQLSRDGKFSSARRVSQIPLFYLLVVAILLWAWQRADQ